MNYCFVFSKTNPEAPWVQESRLLSKERAFVYMQYKALHYPDKEYKVFEEVSNETAII